LSDAVAGGVVTGCALPYAFVAGAFTVAPSHAGLTGLGAPSLLLGSAVLLVFSVIGLTAVAATARVFVAGLGAGVAGLLAAALSLAGMSAEGAAAVTLTVTIGALPAYPSISVWLGRIPVPALPSRPEEILSDREMPRRNDVFAAVARATEILTGALLATSIVAIGCVGVLIAADRGMDTALALTAAAALLLRGRLFAAPAQRVPLLTAGAAAVAVLLTMLTVRATATHTRLLVLLVVLIVAALVLAAALVYSKRAPSPRIGRLADIVDVLTVMALVPLAFGVAGVFSSIASTSGSVGG
jgi:type VII secretion integral membrane protein EccD